MTSKKVFHKPSVDVSSHRMAGEEIIEAANRLMRFIYDDDDIKNTGEALNVLQLVAAKLAVESMKPSVDFDEAIKELTDEFKSIALQLKDYRVEDEDEES